MNDVNSIGRLAQTLADHIGAEHVLDDADTLDLFSQDIYSRAEQQAGLVIAPGSSAELSACVAAITAADVPVISRGGGMSYTGAYLPARKGTVMIDMRRMNRIIEIDADNMFVTVEVGCTWADLYQALKDRGLRTPFWGPLSGIKSTVGGALSQHASFLGSGFYGTSADHVTSISVVLASGDTVHTGSASTEGALPFSRHYGPDLTGLFLGDTGALGIKATASFRLIQLPEHEGYASFTFPSMESFTETMSAFARAGIASDMFGMDPNLQKIRMKRASMSARAIGKDLKTLGGVVKKQKNVLTGIKEAAKIAIAGRNFINDNEYSIHLMTEGRSEAAVAADLALARDIAAKHRGREVENTIPKVIRAQPFGPLNNLIGPDGERWVPVHGYLPHTKVQQAWAAIDEYFAQMADEFKTHGIFTSYLLSITSTNAFLLEPVLYWEDELYPLHLQSIEKDVAEGITRFEANAKARAIIDATRTRIKEILSEFGAIHFQIGKSYPYREHRKAATWSLLTEIKNVVDPKGLINPGSLGLD